MPTHKAPSRVIATLEAVSFTANHARSFRLLWSLSLLALMSAAVGTQADTGDIVPLPAVHVVTKVIRFQAKDALLVRSITVGNLDGGQLRVSCNRCRRYSTKIHETRPNPTTKSYSGVSWIIVDGRDIQVELTHPGRVGRFLLLAASGGHALVFRTSGCLSKQHRHVRCPNSATQPAPGSPVPVGKPLSTLNPTTTITTGPSGYVANTTVTFDYSSDEADVTYECQLDSTVWTSCATGSVTYSGLIDGSHNFSVRAINSSGLMDTAPPTRSWAQESTPPLSTVISEPSTNTTSTTAAFDFSASETSTFQCQLDGGVWVTCDGGSQSYEGLGGGIHTFDVRATNQAGVTEATPTQFSWTVHVPVTDYSCPAGSGQNGHYVPSGDYWGNPFTALGGTVTGGYLLIGADEDGNDHNALIGIYSNGETGGPLAEVVVAVHGYGGVHFTFPQPVNVSPNQQLWITVFGDGGNFTAYDTNEGDQCFVGDLEGYS
jgi:hypothetical protein